MERQFQSYLYGIEIFQTPCAQNPSCCFNRTFMELKLQTDAQTSIASLFQSYLYGIEIAINPLVGGALVSFNRTFMELKWVSMRANRAKILISFNRTFMELK